MHRRTPATSERRSGAGNRLQSERDRTMGTNYYWYNPKPAYEHCGRRDDDTELHIGKSSAGWVFHLRIHPDCDIHDLDDWVDRFYQDGSIIKNEYGSNIDPQEMLTVILVRFKLSTDIFAWTAEELARNHAVRGPMGLAASADHKMGCGTYDITEREFC